MSIEYKRVPTTHAVYRAIVNEHGTSVGNKYDIGVYESYTNIVENGICTIYTVWGLKSAEVALVGAETKYDAVDDKEVEGTRKSEYWLCAPHFVED